MPNPYKIINLDYLNSITDGSDELIKELIAIFIEQIPEFREGFDEGFGDKDWSKIAAVAHKAKSSVMSMGMDDLGNNELKNLELLAKLMKVDELKSDDSAENEVEQLKKSVNSYPDDRIEWLVNNKSEDKVKEIIDNFNQTCDAALDELHQVLEN